MGKVLKTRSRQSTVQIEGPSTSSTTPPIVPRTPLLEQLADFPLSLKEEEELQFPPSVKSFQLLLHTADLVALVQYAIRKDCVEIWSLPKLQFSELQNLQTQPKDLEEVLQELCIHLGVDRDTICWTQLEEADNGVFVFDCVPRMNSFMREDTGLWQGSVPLLANFPQSASLWPREQSLLRFPRTADWFFIRQVDKVFRSGTRVLCEGIQLVNKPLQLLLEKLLLTSSESTQLEENWFKAMAVWPKGNVPACSRTLCSTVVQKVNKDIPWPYDEQLLPSWDPLFKINRDQIQQLQQSAVTAELSCMNSSEVAFLVTVTEEQAQLIPALRTCLTDLVSGQTQTSPKARELLIQGTRMSPEPESQQSPQFGGSLNQGSSGSGHRSDGSPRKRRRTGPRQSPVKPAQNVETPVGRAQVSEVSNPSQVPTVTQADSAIVSLIQQLADQQKLLTERIEQVAKGPQEELSQFPKVAPLRLSISVPKDNFTHAQLHQWVDLALEKVRSGRQDPSAKATAVWLTSSFSGILDQWWSARITADQSIFQWSAVELGKAIKEDFPITYADRIEARTALLSLKRVNFPSYALFRSKFDSLLPVAGLQAREHLQWTLNLLSNAQCDEVSREFQLERQREHQDTDAPLQFPSLADAHVHFEHLDSVYRPSKVEFERSRKATNRPVIEQRKGSSKRARSKSKEEEGKTASDVNRVPGFLRAAAERAGVGREEMLARWDANKCVFCGEEGHKANKCPKRKDKEAGPKSQSKPKPKTKP
mgnify:FL=1